MGGDLQNLLINYDFKNCHELVTHPLSNTCLDHVYTNILKPINVDTIGCNLSDHNLIHYSVDFGFQISDDVQKCYSVCDYGKFKVVYENSLNHLYIHKIFQLTLLIFCVYKQCNRKFNSF